jgi:RHS repeat-associated protein
MLVESQNEGAPGFDSETWDIATIRASAPSRVVGMAMMPPLACLPSEAPASAPLSTGKERDAESGNDYFNARYMASSMGRFLSPDPSNLSVDFWLPQTWNRYTYGLNNPLTMVDKNGLWPWYVHWLIDDSSFPGMSKQDLKSIKNASWNMDFAPGQQDPSNAYQHGMSNGSDNVGGSPGTLQEDARQDADNFISQQVAAAQQAQADWEAQGHSGIAPAALTAFGNALHTAQDRTSPSHQGEQPWANKPWYSKDTLSHVWRERWPSKDQWSPAQNASRALFQRTFGDEFDWMFFKEPCARTGAVDSQENWTGWSGCQ